MICVVVGSGAEIKMGVSRVFGSGSMAVGWLLCSYIGHVKSKTRHSNVRYLTEIIY